MTEVQPGMICPQCGSGAAVHAVSEVADLARMQLDQLQQGLPGPGFGGQPPQGGTPGYAAQPGQIDWQSNSPNRYYGRADDNPSIADDIAGIAIGAAAKFIGRTIGRRVQRTFDDRAMPVLVANAEARWRELIAIAERYPELRGCFTDKVTFLAGGTRVVPTGDIMKMTLDQADALVAALRNG